MARSAVLLFLIVFSFCGVTTATQPLRVLTENWPPMAYEENGKKSGMAFELTELLLKKINASKPSTIEFMPFARGYHTALTRPNTVLFSVIRTPEREVLFNFLGPITHGEAQLFAKPNSALAAHTGPVNKKLLIATVRGSAYEAILQQHGFKNVILVSDPITNIKLLMSGRVDLICDDALAIDELTHRAGFKNVDLPKISGFGETTFYYAFSKGTSIETQEAWKNALHEVKKNGEFKALYSKWFKKLTPSLDVVLTNSGQQNTTLQKDTRPFGVADVK